MIVIWEKSIPYLKYVRPEVTAINISTPWTISQCGQKMEVIQQFSSPSSTVTIILKEKKSLIVGNVMGLYSFPIGEGNQLLKTVMRFIIIKAFSGCRWKWQTRSKKAQDIIIPPFLQEEASHQLLGVSPSVHFYFMCFSSCIHQYVHKSAHKYHHFLYLVSLSFQNQTSP